MQPRPALHEIKPADLPAPPRSAVELKRDDCFTAGLLLAKTASLFHCLARHGQDPARLLFLLNNKIGETSVRGATLFLYSDCVTEAKTVIGGMLGQQGLVTLLRLHAGKPPAQCLQAMVDAIRPQQQLHDDITLLTVSGE